MKLIIGIVHKDDASHTTKALVSAGFYVTKLATTGGFFKKGNVTLLVGTEEENVSTAVGIIKSNACMRTTKDVDHIKMPIDDDCKVEMMESTEGGATVFVVEVDKFMKI